MTTKFATRHLMMAAACSFAFASMGLHAEGDKNMSRGAGTSTGTSTGAGTSVDPRNDVNAARDRAIDSRTDRKENRQDALEQLDEAAEVVGKMRSDANLARVLGQAQGIFVLPNYGRVAFGVGARGGQGVLLLKQGSDWGKPVFYNTGGISAGFQAGAEAGSLVMILNNQKAVKSFQQTNNWSLNADAGLTVINWSARGQASVGKGDVIVWSDTAGLLGDVAVSLTNIRFDEEDTAGYYGRKVSMNDIFSGKVTDPNASALKQALTGKAGATSGKGARSRADDKAK